MADGSTEGMMRCIGCGEDFDWQDDAQSRYHERACVEVDESAREEIARRLRTTSGTQPMTTETKEAQALWYLLHILGEFGRDRIRPFLLEQAADEEAGDGARNLLNQINKFDRATSQLDRVKEATHDD